MIEIDLLKTLINKDIFVTYGSCSTLGKLLKIECGCIVLKPDEGENKYIVMDKITGFQIITNNNSEYISMTAKPPQTRY